MMLERHSKNRVAAFSEAVSEEANVAITSSSTADFTDLVAALKQSDDVATMKILTDSDTVTELRDLFFTTTHLVDYIQTGTIEIRAQDSPLQSCLITEDAVGAIAGFPDANPTVVETTQESVVQDTRDTFEMRFEEAKEPIFRKPAFSTLFENLADTFDTQLVEDFEEALEAAKEPERPGLEINPVYVSILVGGYHEVSSYKLSRCGEYARLGSPAQFSRKKRDLEELELIETESIPTDVGRPPQRLLLGDSVNQQMDIGDIIATAIEKLP